MQSGFIVWTTIQFRGKYETYGLVSLDVTPYSLVTEYMACIIRSPTRDQYTVMFQIVIILEMSLWIVLRATNIGTYPVLFHVAHLTFR
jgi:hypothetical protein